MDSYSISSFLYPSPPDTPFTTPSQSTSSTDDLGDPYSIPTNKSMTRKHSLPLTAPNSPESNALDKQIQMVEPLKPDGGSVPIASGSITSNLQQLLGGIDVDSCEVDGESAFFVADLSEVYRQHVRWINALPRVIPFYAVKCNPDPYVLRLLAALGTGFDCASNGEIQSVLDLGVSPSRIIYANPCKASSFVRQAASQGVGLTTFDNIDELYKMKKFHPNCKLVVRILTDDSKSACQLGLKFGAPLATVPRLLEKAKELELDVVGVSFHVGSGCYDPESFRDAILRARKAFEIGKDFGYTFDLLDVGGGYDHSNFEMIADVLRPAIDECFPDQDFAPGGKLVEGKKNGLRIIAEPGRYYVQKAFVLAANIIARRDGRKEDEENSIPRLSEEDPSQKETTSNEMEISTQTASTTKSEEKPEVMYYQNDGMYGAFNCIMFDHQVVHPKVLTLNRQFCYRSDLIAPGVGSLTSLANSSLTQKDLKLRPCSIWGPTCDSIDCVRPLAHLPDATSVGDWLVYEDMGAYTICAASGFNGLRKSEVKYTFGTTKEEDMNADGTAEKVRELMI